MEIKKVFIGTMAAALLAIPTTTTAQDSLKAEIELDLVSHYMWRGTDKGGITILPAAKLSWKGASVQLQGTTGFDNDDPKEINLTLGYKYKMFNVGLTDYWTSGMDYEGHSLYFEWDPVRNSHQLEANFGVDLRWCSLQAYTIIWGNDFKYSTITDSENRTNGKRAFSTFIELRVPFYFASLDWDASVGVTPFESACIVKEGREIAGFQTMEREHFYADQTALVMASLRATKRFELGDVKVPVFAEVHTNPYMKRANFLVGVSIQPFK